MARKPRYHVSGAFYHVMLRGNNGQKIFFNDLDRCRLCFLFQEGLEKYDHRIHAFCFMGNHIHLLVETRLIPLSKIVHNLTFRYSQEVNKRYGKIGHLFQGRFKSILLDEEGYFLKLIRYIHMNPVRAKLVDKPEDYVWSGHNTYLGTKDIPWLTIERCLLKFTNIKEIAQKLYAGYVVKFVDQEELNEFRRNFKDGQVLGDEAFFETLKKENNAQSQTKITFSHILEATCVVFQIEREILTSPSQIRLHSLARGALVSHAYEKGISLEEIARILNRDASSLSSLKKRYSLKVQQCPILQQQVDIMKQKTLELADLQA